MTGKARNASVFAAALLLIVSTPVAAQNALPTQSERIVVDNFVVEAAQRFGIPAHWVWAIMRAESGGVVRATSAAGAMGLMQIMPATWDALRKHHGLGNDPYDVRDNILAGAAYLRAMHDRYGPTGMLAAYNAGPGRYEDYLLRARPLPAETLAYMAKLAPVIGIPDVVQGAPTLPSRPLRWTQAALFIVRAETPNAPTQAADDHATDAPVDRGSTPQQHPGLKSMNSLATGLFVPLSGSNRP